MDEAITTLIPQGMTLFGRVAAALFVFQIILSFVRESAPML